ncbi:MAG: hypothetical protein JWQ40_3698 [Segetibacter sp.]|nr:hypothetical protein [Segetibacter sp.]
MATEQPEQNKQDSNQDAAVKPDAETLKTTDPQEHMEGPLSSLMQTFEKTFDTDETKEEAEERKNI